MTNPVSAELKLAQMFHEAYERLAPSFGYETRAETRTFDQNSNNGKLMIAVCAEIISAAAASGAKVPEETILHLDSIVKFAYSHGFHELGYDPIATIRSCIAALTPAPVKEVPEERNLGSPSGYPAHPISSKAKHHSGPYQSNFPRTN